MDAKDHNAGLISKYDKLAQLVNASHKHVANFPRIIEDLLVLNSRAIPHTHLQSLVS